MKFSTSTVAAASLAVTAALPQSTPAPKPVVGDIFSVMAIRSGAPFHLGSIQAAQRGFRIGGPAQGAFCDRDNINYASFQLTNEGELYLNTDNPPQRAFVDRSGMGQGVFKYTTGAQDIGRNQERGPFTVDDDHNLVFVNANGATTGFQACPIGNDGGYSVWLDTGVLSPGGNSNCTGFIARAIKEDNPVKCQYTQ
ncbi:hypothetical protein FB567DRAFT_25972 [Paraphoma chrysanthemicola]|uniref:Cell wall protein PhiA n=1 Tax=Paraphoma chrysanthemicola TaxID=798071 RepID=A0A8K0W442_9PLEO|nr:hypothetical protein FB567DRAFT_25972 [Paraphoma chrysanthemicola]